MKRAFAFWSRCLKMRRQRRLRRREVTAQKSFFTIATKQDREAFALDLAERERLVMVPPYDDYFILAGQGTCGLELVEEVPDLDCVLTPCSGGGLFAGVATAAKALNPRIQLLSGRAGYCRRYAAVVVERRTRFDSAAADNRGWACAFKYPAS